MQRFYFENLENTDESIIIKNPDLLNQLNKVLRIKTGQEFIFFNGKENIDYIFKSEKIDKKEIHFEKIGVQEVNNEIDFTLNIFQSIPNKIEKIEYILQKAVEVGVSNFYFYKSQRSQNIILGENKINRFKKIIIEAVEQSGRSLIPNLTIEKNINFESLQNTQNIFFHTDNNNSINIGDLKIDYTKTINIFIGLEGGFCNEEIEIFKKYNFDKVYLGKRILRTETTGIVSAFFIIQNQK